MWNGLGGQGQVWNVINEEALKDALENLNSPKNSQVFCPTSELNTKFKLLSFQCEEFSIDDDLSTASKDIAPAKLQKFTDVCMVMKDWCWKCIRINSDPVDCT